MTSISSSPLDSYYSKNLGDFIVPKNELLVDVKKNKAVELILSELKKIPNWEQYKTSLEFLRMACNFCENMLTKSDGINKLDVIISVFQTLFSLTVKEIEVLKTSVEFLLNNKRIKKITFVKKAAFFLFTTIKKLF